MQVNHHTPNKHHNLFSKKKEEEKSILVEYLQYCAQLRIGRALCFRGVFSKVYTIRLLWIWKHLWWLYIFRQVRVRRLEILHLEKKYQGGGSMMAIPNAESAPFLTFLVFLYELQIQNRQREFFYVTDWLDAADIQGKVRCIDVQWCFFKLVFLLALCTKSRFCPHVQIDHIAVICVSASTMCVYFSLPVTLQLMQLMWRRRRRKVCEWRRDRVQQRSREINVKSHRARLY